MSRIDAVVATQVADVARPQQSAREIQLQAEESKKKSDKKVEEDSSQEVTSSDLRAAAAQLQQVVEAAGIRNLSFGFGQDKKSQDTFLVIREQDSGDVIRQIPGEEVLSLRNRIREMIGIMFDKKA